MANSCDFEMKVKGKSESVETLIKLLKDHELDESEERYFGGWLENIMYEMEDDPINQSSIAFVTGGCKWSVILSLLGVKDSYYDEDKKDYGDKSKVTCLENESKRLNLDIEIYSSEYGVGFEEHFLIKEGELLINDCVNAWQLDEMYFENEDLSEEFKEIVERFYKKKISNNEWEELHKWLLENPRNYRLGGYDEWKFEI